MKPVAGATFVQFDCEGCGTDVVMFGTSVIPAGHYCLICGFIEWSPIHTMKVKQELHERLGTMRKLEWPP